MITYQSQTSNGGKTIILACLADAIDTGRGVAEGVIKNYDQYDPKTKVKVGYASRDGKVKHKVKTIATFKKEWLDTSKRFEDCVEAITHGDDGQKEQIAELCQRLRDLVIDLQPSLCSTFSGFQRHEEGVDALAELVASGEENPCLRRKPGGDLVRQGEGDGAYRIIINTDVSWWGKPDDNAAVMGALVLILQSFKPVEIWIQQGWMGDHPNDGVTLFKLDFTGGFDPTQLAFWVGHPQKDGSFSFLINKGLERENTKTSCYAEIVADLYLRGDWMELGGLGHNSLAAMSHLEQVDAMAAWIAATAMKIVFGPGSDDVSMAS